MHGDDVEGAVGRAAEYLRDLQELDGSWWDYELPVGASDAWVTAYVGLAMSEWDRPGAIDPVRRACAWLAGTRPYRAGWGFNGCTGPDADTTAHALQLLRRHGEVREEDEAWLLGLWREPGGFATYASPGAWATVHPCVTPVASAALSPAERERRRGALLAYLERTRMNDGTWPSYWWRSGHYATFHNLALARLLGAPVEDFRPVVGVEERVAVHAAFDLAFVLGSVLVTAGAGPQAQALAGQLVSLQRPDGSFPGAANLRVTHQDCHRPWERPAGALYADHRHTITTASALRMLARFLRARRPQ